MTSSPRRSASRTSTRCVRRSRERMQQRIRPAARARGEAPAARRAGRATVRRRPKGMVEEEFDADLAAPRAGQEGRQDAEDEDKDEETLKAEYRAIAERRVRLGLLLAEIGRANSITVTPDEMTQAMARGDALSRPGTAGVGVLPQEPAGRRDAARRRSSRRRWSTSSSSSPRSTEKTVTPEELTPSRRRRRRAGQAGNSPAQAGHAIGDSERPAGPIDTAGRPDAGHLACSRAVRRAGPTAR